MSSAPHASARLDMLVSGKRRVDRLPVRLPVSLRGVQGEFEGTVHDLSMDGALVHVPVAALSGGEAPLGPAEQFALLERHFRDSFDLQFEGRDVVVEAQVVRLLVSPDAQVELALGCSFVHPLSEHQQTQLGLRDTSGDLLGWGEATLHHDLRWAADPARPVAAFLLNDVAVGTGPRFVGPVRALGRCALLVRLAGVAREDVVRDLGGGTGVRVLRGARELCSAEVELVAVRYSDTPAPGTEILLATSVGLPRSLRRHFRRA